MKSKLTGSGLSHKYKTLFIRIPKTASTSIITALEMEHNDHITWIESFENNKDYLHYIKFAVVRNPWDRFVSEYFFIKMVINCYHDSIHNGKSINPLYNRLENLSFKDFVLDFYNNPTFYCDYSHYTPQYKFICDDNMNVMVDLILRYENLEEDIKKIDRDIVLPKINVSEHLPYRYYYDNETKIIIGEIYKKDIEIFGYEY